MKLSLTIAVFLLALPAWAQQFHFSGTISGLADENLNVRFPADHFGTTWTESIPVKDGAFSKEVTVPASGMMHLSYKGKDRNLFIWKDCDSLTVSFDAEFLEDDQTIRFGGDGAAILLFQKEVDKKFGERLSLGRLASQAKDATNIDALEMDIFRLRNEAVDMMQKFTPALPEEFKKFYKNHLGYFYFLSLFRFAEAKTASSSIPKATEIPKVLIEGLTWERMNLASELDSEFFRELLLSYVNYRALEAYEHMKFADRQATVQQAFNIAREHLQGESLRYFLTKTLLAEAGNVQPSLLSQMHAHLKGVDETGVFYRMVEDSLAAQLSAKDEEVEVAAPMENDLELRDMDGKTFRLSDLRGKVIYLDIWASWCGPCRQQFPYAKALKERFSKKELKNIVFLYISIDNTEEAWKKAIEQLQLEGTHGFSPGGWGAEITTKFGVRSIPRYLIFDKTGRLTHPNAPRPSEPTLEGTLKELMAQ